MLPKPVVYEKISGFTPGAGEDMIAGRDHENGTAKNWFTSNERVMISVV